MPITCLFTQQQNKEIRQLRKREKKGETIDWMPVLDRMIEEGREKWKRYMKK